MWRMRVILAVAVVLVGSGSARSEELYRSPVDGNAILKACSQPENAVLPIGLMYCWMSASGYLDMMKANGYRCSSDNGNVIKKQAGGVLGKYLKDHPEVRNKGAAKLAIYAFRELFDCQLGAEATAYNYFDTGNSMFEDCSADTNNIDTLADTLPREMRCRMTTLAYLDMMLALGFRCGNLQGVTQEQIVDVFKKYLADHPELRNHNAALLAQDAFNDAFRCARASKLPTPPRM
jgi:Rap1a immunity proteins